MRNGLLHNLRSAVVERPQLANLPLDHKPRFDGEWVGFQDAFEEVSRGVRKIKQKDYLASGFYPIVDQSQSAVAGYSNEQNGLYVDVPAIVFGDHTRCVKYVETPFFIGADGVKILKPKLSDDVRYWWHALRATPIENLGYSRHYKLLKEKLFRSFDLDMQVSIRRKLDRVLLEIDCAEQVLSKLDVLVKSRFVEMFGLINENPRRWETAALEDVAPICYQPVPQNGMVWQLNLDAVEAESGTVVSKCQVDAGELKGSIGGFAGSQVLYSKLRPYLNKVVLPDCPGVCTTELLPLTPDLDRIDRVYLASSLRSSEFVAFASSHSNGAKMPRVDMKAFKKFEIPVPPIERQQEFASFVAEVDKSGFSCH